MNFLLDTDTVDIIAMNLFYVVFLEYLLPRPVFAIGRVCIMNKHKARIGGIDYFVTVNVAKLFPLLAALELIRFILSIQCQ